jgi:protein translocase SEC61 complex gamma subunit
MQIKSFLNQMGRVWKLLRKPSSLEFKTIAKVSAIGLLAIGFVGFFVSLLMGFFK